MRAMEAIVLIVIVIALVILFIGPPAIKAIAHAFSKLKRQHDANEPWTVGDINQNGFTQVFISKPGEKSQNVGPPVSLALPSYEYDELLTERRLDALDKASSLNRKLLPG